LVQVLTSRNQLMYNFAIILLWYTSYPIWLFNDMLICIILVWHVPLAQVLSHPQLIFPSKTWLFRIYLNFQWQKWFKRQYFPLSKSKSYQINSINSCSSRPFQNTKSKFQFFQNFQLWFNLIYSEKIIQYLRTFALPVQTSWSQTHATNTPPRSRTFQRH
jgi:hypothetical protein